MKNFLIAFGVFLAWSFFGLWIYSWLQPKSDLAKVATEIPVSTQPDNLILKAPPVIKVDSTPIHDNISNTIHLNLENTNANGLKATNEAGDIVFNFSEGISIKKNTVKINIPSAIFNFKNKINTYLLEHPNQKLQINSIYSPKENVLSPNIGIQRANEVSKLLLLSGLPKEKLVTKSVIKDINFNNNNDFNNGIYFTFKPLDVNNIQLVEKTTSNIRTVYPKFSDSGILVNNDLKVLLKDLKKYFDNNPTKKIDIIGHTDNIGNGIDNYNIGLKYAQQVRWYLISEGHLNKKLIKASSKGESEPIEDNNTHLGRIANRRIEIIFN